MFELSEAQNKKGLILEWANKVNLSKMGESIQFSEQDTLLTSEIDKWAKEIGEGKRPAKELSMYFQKVIAPEVYEAPTELLNRFFNDNPSIGEFDSWDIEESPKNTLQAYLSAKGGNVDKSYIDFEAIAPVTKHLQIETELKMADLRKDGYKTIANMTQFAINELRNKMFFEMMTTLDGTITGGTQTATDTTVMSETSMDKLVKYLRANRTTGDLMTISNSDRAFEVSKLDAAVDYYSDNMKDQLNQTGKVSRYNGVDIQEIAAARATGNGEALINAARLYGIAGTIGEKAMKGNLRVLVTEDNKNEVIELKFAGFEFTYAITFPEKVFKITIN